MATLPTDRDDWPRQFTSSLALRTFARMRESNIRGIGRWVLAIALAAAAPRPGQSQDVAVPHDSGAMPAAAADVQSIDAILHAAYDAISGPAGPRNWQRFYSLFAPGARLIPTRHDSTGATHL